MTIGVTPAHPAPIDGRLYLLRARDAGLALVLWHEEFPHVLDRDADAFRPSSQAYDAIAGHDILQRGEWFEVAAEEAAALLAAGQIGSPGPSWYIDGAESVPRAAVLSGVPASRPVSPRERVAQIRAELTPDQWTPYRSYEAAKAANAYAAANQLRQGRIKGLPPVDAEIQRTAAGIDVVVKLKAA